MEPTPVPNPISTLCKFQFPIEGEDPKVSFSEEGDNFLLLRRPSFELPVSKMAEGCRDLPDECWEIIFSGLDHQSHFEPLSLVCKRFLSITNHLRLGLAVTAPTISVHGTISKLIRRFRNLKSINLSASKGQLESLVLEIAHSVFNIESLDISNHKTIPITGLAELGLCMKSLKVLKCSNLCILRDSDLVAMSNSLPWLEELDLSYPQNHYGVNIPTSSSSELTVTDNGIEALSSNLKNLHRINISGNHFITDRSLVALSSNCFFLSEVVVLDCSLLTHNGICFLMCHCSNLRSVSVNGILVPRRSTTFENLIICASTLCTLDFFDMHLSDQFLCSIARAGIPLKRLTLSYCSHFTFLGISLLLQTYQFLEYLALIKADFITDQSFSNLCQYLRSIVTIKLSDCHKLTDSTFFSLGKNCVLLKDIEIKATNMGKGDQLTDFARYQQIKSLNMAGNLHLTDECLEIIASSCPSLEHLDVSSCLGITEGGIAELLKACCNIRLLRIDGCKGIKSIGTGLELSKFESLCAARSAMNDEGLAMVGKRCQGLLKLDLEGCLEVTTKGVVEAFRCCKRLREINLMWCRDVHISMVDLMVLSRLSTRKIALPSHSFLTENQRRHLLLHGYEISDG